MESTNFENRLREGMVERKREISEMEVEIERGMKSLSLDLANGSLSVEKMKELIKKSKKLLN